MKRLLTLILPLLLTACAGSEQREEPAELPKFDARASVERLWSADTGKGPQKKSIVLTPVLQDGQLYVSDARGQVSAYDAATGKRRWRTQLDKPVTGGVGAGAGLLLIGTRKGEVIALNAQDGQQRWSAAVSTEVLAPPAAAEGVVVVQAGDGKLFGLAATDGSLIWSVARGEPALTLRGTAAPLIVRDAVLAGFANGRVAAVALKDGQVRWETVVAEPRGRNEIERLVDVDAAPAVRASSIYAAAYQGRAAALNMESGRLLWWREMSAYAGLDSDSQQVYVGDERDQLFALDARTGASLWRQEGLSLRQLSAATVAGNYVVVGDFEGYVHWLDKKDGAFVARYGVGDPVKAKILADGQGTFYVLDQDGDLTALRLR